jgi:hypothetical protein
VKIMVLMLSVGAFLLPTVATVVGYVRVKRAWRTLSTRLDSALAELRSYVGSDPDGMRAATKRAADVLRPSTTYADALYMREHITVALLRSTVGQLRGPALVASLGGLCGMAAAVLQLL